MKLVIEVNQHSLDIDANILIELEVAAWAIHYPADDY